MCATRCRSSDSLLVTRDPGGTPDTEGIEELRAAFGRFHEAFPDLHIALDDVITADDRVAARWTATGTHRGELAGIPATGRSVRWGGIDVYRLDPGMVVEWRHKR